jgi:hypothetical protein
MGVRGLGTPECTVLVLETAPSWYRDPATYRPRLADAHVGALLTEFPAVMINGARATGTTTTARQHVAEMLSLDVPGIAASMRAELTRCGRVPAGSCGCRCTG